jgi:hypothetical protein
MFAEFIDTYGMELLMAVVTTIAGYLGVVIKNLYTKYINDQTKKDVVKTVVQGIEQICKDVHGEEKLNAALENASEMLELKGITVSKFELVMLIEAAVAEFNNAFNKTE